MAKNKNSSFSVMDGFDFKKQVEEKKTENLNLAEQETESGSSVESDSRQIIEVMPKGAIGRPKVYEEETKFISCRLKVSNYEYAKIHGGRFGGVTGYINYLIEKDRGIR